MMTVDLYNLDPVLQIMGMGLLVAGLPLSVWAWRHRHAPMQAKLRALTWLTLFLTFDLVLFGAFTRLTDSGLGCPDWPGCYGAASPVGAKQHIQAAQTVMPDGPVTHGKAWIEMVHRYLATGVGVMLVALALGTRWAWHRAGRPHVVPPWMQRRGPVLLVLWVLLQGAFGALTVTMKLFPAIVTLHLLLGVALLAWLVMQAHRHEPGPAVTLSPRWRQVLLGAGGLLWLQLALGGWVSTNYAVLACPDFPTCLGEWVPPWNGLGFDLWRPLGRAANGDWLPMSALVSIHFVHRSMAWLVLGVLAVLAWRLRRVPGLSRPAQGLAGLVLLQLATGVSNVVLGWPLLAAVLHTGGAAAMVMVLTWMAARTRAFSISSLAVPEADSAKASA